MSKRMRVEACLTQTPAAATSVQVVCRCHVIIASLPHVAHTVDTYLHDLWSTWTLESASDAGFVGLLDRLVAQEWTGVSGFFREQRFENAINKFFEQNNGQVPVLNWWLCVYYPTYDAAVFIPRLVQLAIEFNRLDVLAWLHDEGKLTFYLTLEDLGWVSCKHPQIVYWLHEHARGIVKTLVLHDYCAKDQYFAYIKWAQEHREDYEIDGLWHALHHAIRHGDIGLLRWMYDQYPDIQSTCGGLRDAVHNGHLEVAKWLYMRHPKLFFYCPYEGSCDMKMIHWLLNEYDWRNSAQREAWIQRSIEISARHNQIQLVEILCSLKPIPVIQSGEAMKYAAERGHLEMIQCLHLHHAYCTPQAMDHAAANNHLNVVEWLHEYRPEGCTTKAMDFAAANGHLEMVRWLHENRSEGCTSHAMEEAAERGYFEIIEFLYRNGLGTISEGTLENSVVNNHMEIAKWMHAHSTQRMATASLLHRTGRYGLLDMVKWFHENGYEDIAWNAMDGAAAAGHIQIVQYLCSYRNEGCSLEAVHKAATKGHIEIIKWYCGIRPQKCELVEDAATHGHLKIVKFLLENGEVKWDAELLQEVADEKHFGILEWLLRYSRKLNVESLFLAS